VSSSRTAMAVAAGTITLFVWGAVSHLVLIRGVGFAALPTERGLEETVARDAIAPGLYAFPAPPDWRGEPITDAAMATFEARFRDGPSGLLVIRPPGEAPVSPRKLLVQLAANLVAASVATVVVAGLSGGYLRRAARISALGIVGLASVGVILWNWYAFTDPFFAALCLDVVGGWILLGAVVTALVPVRAS
jgi:hypothetical protein